MELTASAAWLNTVFAGFDQSITIAVHELYNLGGGFFTPFFEFISFLGKGGVPLIILSLILALYKPTRRFGTAMCISLAVGALITNCCLKILIARPRPYADESSIFYQFWLLVGQNIESDKSFPSGHTTAAFASMTAVFLVGDKRWSWTAYIFAFLMAVARIYLCVHFPSDVLGGIIVGLIGGIAGTLIAQRFPSKWYEKELFRKAGEEKCSDSES
jgi:membrane-associated phospholipid phosphatase